ncbi:dihydrodipicolinate synthase family protein [Roseimaritima sediminicola]|uniref:dihydrodipicolinate synthase family protein n=1 Tax=Roseimaritima sediminicola TaxID=2662066 RepID=UPI001298254A|nr:dihydrodipicolinate synthase family protein [Roseimaritima sediminicola]
MNATAARPIAQLPPVRTGRTIQGMSAILLPLLDDDQIDWPGFRAHVRRTADAGLVPAVNMDTGYANLISDSQRQQVLDETRRELGAGRFVAGVFVGDQPGAAFDWDAHRRGLDQILEVDGTPIIFQSFGLTEQADEDIAGAYDKIGRHAGEFLAFELGQMFAPFGKIYSLELYAELLKIEACRGAKHSSLSRELEWQRLQLRDAQRPDFRVLTGNDLAIDMVMYGSDYLLGLSTFAPEAFAHRDHLWAAGDAGFYELNDLLQYLGFLAFRDPVPAYKHNAAQFLHARGWIQTSRTYPGSPERPDSDLQILQNILDRLPTKDAQ